MFSSYFNPISASFLVLCLTLTPGMTWAGPKEKDSSNEEAVDYYDKWLNDTVVHIIAHDERAVFEKLTSPEEKENFIEQFWRRRDPDPRTMINEFKEEHYRRIAYADDHFSSGLAGRNTDRGRIYIVHGPPADIESYPAGGRYDRTLDEGLGTTIAYPFERWRYRQPGRHRIERDHRVRRPDLHRRLQALLPPRRQGPDGRQGVRWSEVGRDRTAYRQGGPLDETRPSHDGHEWRQRLVRDAEAIRSAPHDDGHHGASQRQVRRPEEDRQDAGVLHAASIRAQERPVGIECPGSAGAVDIGDPQAGAQLPTGRHGHLNRHAGPVWGGDQYVQPACGRD